MDKRFTAGEYARGSGVQPRHPGRASTSTTALAARLDTSKRVSTGTRGIRDPSQEPVNVPSWCLEQHETVLLLAALTAEWRGGFGHEEIRHSSGGSSYHVAG